MKRIIFLSLLTLCVLSSTYAGNKVTRIPDVIYDHRDGAGHGWPYNKADEEALIKWFEKYLPAR